MKREFHIVLVAATILLALSGCSSEEICQPDPVSVESEAEIPVRLGFSMDDSAGGPLTKASIIGGEEGFVNPQTGAVNLINDIKMLCFTSEGIYLGHRTATLIGDEGAFVDGCPWGRELFEGSVPPRTSRIHFLGNVPLEKIPDNGQIGGNENTIIRSARMSMNTSDRTISYWGFHGESNPDDLKAWLAEAETETTIVDGQQVTIITGYHKKEGSVVHLIRDRARVEFGEMTDFYRADHRIDYKILSIDWIISNGMDHGYIAPYNENNSSDHFSGYYDPESTPKLKLDRLTEYNRADGGRFSAWTSDASTQNGEDEMVRAWDVDNGTYDNCTLFLFEDNNDEMECPKIILRVRYQKNRLSTDPSDQVTKYHTLMIMDAENSPSRIFRNHRYVLNVSGLPWEGLGTINFKDAVESRDYENNKTVSIDDKVTEVNDGKFQLRIEGDTYLIYQDQSDAGSVKTIPFSYTAVDPESSTAGLGTDNFTVEWTKTPEPSFASANVEVASYNPSTGQGTIRFTLGSIINQELQGGQLKLSDRKSGLSRFINIYTISNFSFIPSSGLALVRTGGTRRIDGVSCDTYRLDFRIPADYPSGLYPIKVRMANTTLNPFRVDVNGAQQTGATFGVSVESTENGAILDNETLLGMTFSTVATNRAWNYRRTGDPWNFWFNYTISVKPDYVNEQTVYTIYFDDTRPLRDFQNRALNVGLFLKMRYFGPAVPVYY